MGLSHKHLKQNYRDLMGKILTRGYNYVNIKLEKKALKMTIKTTKRIIGPQLPSIGTLFAHRCRNNLWATLVYYALILI